MGIKEFLENYRGLRIQKNLKHFRDRKKVPKPTNDALGRRGSAPLITDRITDPPPPDPETSLPSSVLGSMPSPNPSIPQFFRRFAAKVTSPRYFTSSLHTGSVVLRFFTPYALRPHKNSSRDDNNIISLFFVSDLFLDGKMQCV